MLSGIIIHGLKVIAMLLPLPISYALEKRFYYYYYLLI